MNPPPILSVPPLGPGQVHVWRVPLEVDPARSGSDCLSADERQRAERFVFPELRRRFVVGRATLRRLLGYYVQRPAEELRLIYGPHGKPELAEGGWHFNVSHSGERALIAVATGGAVGVDLEMIRVLDYEGVGSRVLAAAEMSVLRAAPATAKAETFFRLWVRQEARVKALGTGLGTRAKVPVYDLDVGPLWLAALATAIPGVRIEMVGQDWERQD